VVTIRRRVKPSIARERASHGQAAPTQSDGDRALAHAQACRALGLRQLLDVVLRQRLSRLCDQSTVDRARASSSTIASAAIRIVKAEGRAVVARESQKFALTAGDSHDTFSCCFHFSSFICCRSCSRIRLTSASICRSCSRI